MKDVIFPDIESFMSQAEMAEFYCKSFMESESAEWPSDTEDFIETCEFYQKTELASEADSKIGHDVCAYCEADNGINGIDRTGWDCWNCSSN